MAERKPRKKPLRGARLHRGLSIVPSLFTIGNMFCAYYSVISTLKGNYDFAALAIGVGYLLDGLDGRIARMTQTTSEFGAQLDSIADVLTFGMAPAMLAFHWGLSSIEGIEGTWAPHIRQLGWLATFAFLICGALRLARFNIQSQKPADSSSKRYFVGLPIPAGAGLVAAIVHFFKSPVLQIGSAFLWCLLILLTAFLMISTVRYSSFKELNIKKAGPRMTMVAIAMFIGLVYFYSEEVLLLSAVLYVSSGPIAKLTQVVRRFTPASVSPVAPSEPAHSDIKS